jgi:hypothetical protein
MVTDFLQRERLDSSIRKRIDILFNKISVHINGLFYFLVERSWSIYPGDVYPGLDQANLNIVMQQVRVQGDDIMYEKHYSRSYTGGMDSRQIGHWRRSLIQLSRQAVWKI